MGKIILKKMIAVYNTQHRYTCAKLVKVWDDDNARSEGKRKKMQEVDERDGSKESGRRRTVQKVRRGGENSKREE